MALRWHADGPQMEIRWQSHLGQLPARICIGELSPLDEVFNLARRLASLCHHALDLFPFLRVGLPLGRFECIVPACTRHRCRHQTHSDANECRHQRHSE
jgi:hypothetical protein